MTQPLVVRFGTLHDQLGPPKRDGALMIADGVVAEVSERGLSLPVGALVVDAVCVVPGLINAHGHLEQDATVEPMRWYTASTPTQRAIHAAGQASRALAAGVTTLRDLGASNRIAIEVRDLIRQGKLPGPTVVPAGHVICMTGGHGAFVGREADGPDQIRSAVRKERRDGAEVIKFIATGGVLSPGAVPGAQELSEEELRAGVDEAHRHGLHAAAHAIGTEGIKAALRAGIDSVEHGHLIDEEGIELLLDREAYLVPTLAAIRRITDAGAEAGLPDYVVRKASDIAKQAEANLRRAYQAGVHIAAGSDAGTPFNPMDGFAYELELMHSMLGMSPQEVLRAATVTAADLLGVMRGTLAPGEVADLLVLDQDIDDGLQVLRDPRLVIKGGEIVHTRASLSFAGPHDEEVRDDPGVSDLRVSGGGLLVRTGLGYRLDRQAGTQDGIQPAGQGAARIGDRERAVRPWQLRRGGVEAPGLGERALVEVVADGQRLPYPGFIVHPAPDRC